MTDTTPLPPAMTPGRYMRLRRSARGLSIDALATMLGSTPRETAGFRNEIHMLECGDPSPDDYRPLVDRMAGLFRFDATIYSLLVDRSHDPESELPLPAICRVCGCTWCDPCDPPCSWAEIDLCTACVGKSPANDHGEASHAA
ncbi:MAG: hypothetical protein E6G92_04105 [Alphaproteobacteria bacterium]|nr:MAG: hypothetical protein E6G92_04105 [Alphaproteobacteria bacterium]